MANKFSLLSRIMSKFSEGSIVGLSDEGKLVAMDQTKTLIMESFESLALPEQGFVLEQVLSSQTHIIKAYMSGKLQELNEKVRPSSILSPHQKP